jgi:hypothetical protein
VKNNRHAAVGFVWAFIAARSRGPPARDHYLARRELGRAWKLLLDKKPPKRRMGRRHWLCTILADIAAMLGETDRPSRCARGRGPTMLAGAKAGRTAQPGRRRDRRAARIRAHVGAGVATGAEDQDRRPDGVPRPGNPAGGVLRAFASDISDAMGMQT